jgi:hypothetical protein
VELALDVIKSGTISAGVSVYTHSFGLDEVDRALRLVGEGWDPSAVHVNVVPR